MSKVAGDTHMKTQTETVDLFAQAKQTVKPKQKKDDRTEVVLSEQTYVSDNIHVFIV